MKIKPEVKKISLLLAVIPIMLSGISGCKKTKQAAAEVSGNKYTNRIIMVSDMHYTTSQSAGEYNAAHPGANASVAAGILMYEVVRSRKADKQPRK